MILNLEKLKEGQNEFWKAYTAEELELSDAKDFAVIGSIDTHISAFKSRSNITLKIEAKFELRLTCSRCLEEFNRKFSENVTYFLKAGKEEITEEKALADEDIFTLFYATEELDVKPLVRELVLLAVPMKPLCRPDCKGLCPVCGANWNYETCEHMGKKEKVDVRWSKLLELSQKLDIQSHKKS